MSQENVEIVREAFEYFLRTGEQQSEARLIPRSRCTTTTSPTRAATGGRDGYLRWVADWGEAWEEFSMDAEQWIDAGDRVVSIFRLTARGKGSGVEVTRRDAMIWTVRDRKAVRIDYYNNPGQALEAIGLSE
jgi:ketosteroid isomerase-like protein